MSQERVTAVERAKKIIKEHRNCITPVCPIEKQIVEAIDQACAEAMEEMRNTIHCKVRCGCFSSTQAYAKGYSAAVEDAAKVADPECPDESVCRVNHYSKLAEEIRYLRPSFGGQKDSEVKK